MGGTSGSRGRTRARRAPARARAPPPQPSPTPDPPRARTLHPDLAAALLLALLAFVYLWPALVGGKLLSPAAVLYKLVPWQPYRPAGVAGYENYLLADVPFVAYPWRELVRQLIHAGTFPAWNPHVLAGVPLYTNPQTGLFTPFSLPLWILPLSYGVAASAALKLWAAAFGTYLLVRELRLGFLPGLLAGVGFAFCALNITWLTAEALPAVSVMLPWMLWMVERTFHNPRPSSVIGLAAVTAIALGGGHPGTQVHVMAVTALYAVLRAATLRGLPARERLTPLALAGGGLAAGALLMAAMLVPETLSSHGTVGTAARRGGSSTLPGAQHMPFGMIRTVLLPDWWGRPSAFETASSPTKTLNLNYEERTFYAGVVTFLLACVGLMTRRAWRAMAPFAALGALGLAIALHAPGLYQLVEHLPVIDLVENQRLHFVFDLALAVLAAFGLRAILDRPTGERRRLLVPLLALAIGIVAAASAGASARDVGRVLDHFLTGADTPRTGVVELTSAAWLLLLAAGVGAALLAAERWPGRRVAVAAAIVALAAFDMLHFAHDYNPMGPAGKVNPPRTPAIAYLQRHARDGRFTGIELALPPDVAIRYGLDDIRGYDPPYPTRRYFDLWHDMSPDQVDWQPLTIDGISPVMVRTIGVLGARYIVAEPGVELRPTSEPALRSLHRVYAGRDATIFATDWAVPRTLIAPAVELVPDEASARAALASESFDPRRTVVVERGQPGIAALARASGASGQVAIAAERNADVTLEASLSRPGLVVLNDVYTDGWSVRVDGRPAPGVHVNDVMRGVVVGAGRHRIVWSYTVPGLRVGIVLSALTLMLLLAAGIAPRLRAARRGAG